MTTIAYRDGVMACDSCWTANDVQTTSMTKIDRLSSGALFANAGDSDNRALIALLDKIKTADKLPSKQELAATKCESLSILVLPNGQVWMIGISETNSGSDIFQAAVWPANRGIAAVGSGGELALGAMGAGATPAQAVAVACRFDINSRLPVHQVALKPEPKKSKKSASGVPNASTNRSTNRKTKS